MGYELVYIGGLRYPYKTIPTIPRLSRLSQLSLDYPTRKKLSCQRSCAFSEKESFSENEKGFPRLRKRYGPVYFFQEAAINWSLILCLPAVLPLSRLLLSSLLTQRPLIICGMTTPPSRHIVQHLPSMSYWLITPRLLSLVSDPSRSSVMAKCVAFGTSFTFPPYAYHYTPCVLTAACQGVASLVIMAVSKLTSLTLSPPLKTVLTPPSLIHRWAVHHHSRTTSVNVVSPLHPAYQLLRNTTDYGIAFHSAAHVPPPRRLFTFPSTTMLRHILMLFLLQRQNIAD